VLSLCQEARRSPVVVVVGVLEVRGGGGWADEARLSTWWPMVSSAAAVVCKTSCSTRCSTMLCCRSRSLQGGEGEVRREGGGY